MSDEVGLHFNRFRSRQTRLQWIKSSSDFQPDSLLRPIKDGGAGPSRCSSTETIHRIARTRHDLIAAYQLVYSIYLKHGFTPPRSHAMRVTPYHALAGTDVFVSQQAGRVVCTMTLIEDGELGVPMEALYAEEVSKYRDRGAVTAEVGCLAQRGKDFSVLLRLINLMAQRARFRGIDELLIAVHPRHAKFYERYLGFRLIGPLRSYGAVCGQPAVAMAVNLNQLCRRDPRACGHLFGVPFSLVDLMAPPLSPAARKEVSGWAQEARDSSELRDCAASA